MASATGWSVEYILDGVNYQTLLLMLRDAPRYRQCKETGSGKVEGGSAEAEAAEIAGFFQSQMK